MTLLRRLPLFAAALSASGVAALAQFAPPASEPSTARFANGIVAVAEDKIITVADVSREISPLIRDIRERSKTEKEFTDQVELLQDNMIQELIDRVLIIKEFKKDEKKHIPESFIDNKVAEILAEQFDNDRSKFLAYLRARGTTIREYRKEQEDEIIYHYMQGQQKKSQSVVSPVRIETFYNENKDRFYQEDIVHLRLIQLSRTNSETDAELLTVANDILARHKKGETFDDLAKEFSKDTRRAKGGDWGPMKRSDFKKEFSDPAFSLKKGDASEPILLPEGCFILYAEDRKFAGIQQIDEVRDQIERILITQMSSSSRERWLERLRRNGYVKHY